MVGEGGNLLSTMKLITIERVHNRISKSDQNYSKNKPTIRYSDLISAAFLAPMVSKGAKSTWNLRHFVPNQTLCAHLISNQKPTNTSNISSTKCMITRTN